MTMRRAMVCTAVTLMRYDLLLDCLWVVFLIGFAMIIRQIQNFAGAQPFA